MERALFVLVLQLLQLDHFDFMLVWLAEQHAIT